jgi:hypothetical protein
MEITVEVRTIQEHGLPDMENLTGRVAFIWDGCLVSGWPLLGIDNYTIDQWEADSDVGRHGIFGEITHYIVFPKPMWEIGPRSGLPQ